jgi:hypothetical protein
MNPATKLPYLVVSTALGIIAAILLVPRSGPMTLQYILREGRDKLGSFMNRAIKLRDSVHSPEKRSAGNKPKSEPCGNRQRSGKAGL